MDMRRAVGAGETAEIVGRGMRRVEAEIGAEIGERADSQGQEDPVLVEGELDARVVVAAVVVGQEGFGPRRRPPHRPPDPARGPEQEAVFRERAVLHAEGAADVGRHHAQLVRGDLERRLGELVLQLVRPLRARIQRVAILEGIVPADGVARFDRARGDARHAEIERRDVVGPREGGLDGAAVALLEHEGDIVRDLVRPHRRRARTDRLGGLRHARPVLVIDDDAIGGVEGRGARLGDDDRHGVACEMHLVEGEEAVRRARHGPAVAAFALDARAQQSETVGGGIRAGQDGEHAGRRERVRHVDARDARRRVRRAHHGHMGRVRRLDIVGVAPPPAHEAQILNPRHGRADAEGARPRAVLVDRSRHQIVAGPLSLCGRFTRRPPRPGWW